MNMKRLTLFSIVSTFALIAFALAPRAQADTQAADAWDSKTIVTFHQPVEVPGKILQPGTYVFTTLDVFETPQVVRIFSQDQKHLVGTFLTLPTYAIQPPTTTSITFEERASGQPEAIQTWWYPGDQYGHQFIYR